MKIRLEDYNKLTEVHDDIINILNKAGISIYNGIGILETIKQELFIKEIDEEL